MGMLDMGSLLGSVQSLNNLNITKQYQTKTNSLYDKRQASGYYEELRESNPELATMQQQVDKLNAEAGTIIERMVSPEPSMDSIMAKMSAGKELSPAELEYLKKTDPELYSKAVQVAAEKKAYEEKLKNCKTKEDVQRVKLAALSAVMTRVNDISNNPNIPDGKKLEMIQHEGRRAQAINEATAEYAASGEYAQKPTDAERNAENRAERAEREESLNPEPKPEAEAEPQKAQGEGPAAEEAPWHVPAAAEAKTELPGEGKAVATGAEAGQANMAPGSGRHKMQAAFEAYRRMR